MVISDTYGRVESATSKQLVDKIYEKRKAAALELEKCASYFPPKFSNSSFNLIGRSENATKREIPVALVKSSTN